MEQRVVFVVNPNAGGGKAARRWPEVQILAEQLFGTVHSFYTESPGDGVAQARSAAALEPTLVVSVGGDGTHNEVVNGLMQAGYSGEFGILSIGTGGDFRKTWGIGADPEEALQQLAQGESVPLDVGAMNYIDLQENHATRYFVNIASVGIGGLADKKVNETTKALGGKFSFITGILRAIFEYSNQPATVQVDGKVVYDGPLFLLAVCNGQYFGSGLQIGPDADPTDGMFDLVILQDLGLRDKLALAPYMYRGTHRGRPGITMLRGAEIVVETTSRDVWIDLDGEFPGRMPGRFHVCKGAMQFRRPKA